MKKHIALVIMILIFLPLVGFAVQGNPPTTGGNPPTSGGNPPTGGGNPSVPISINFENPFAVGDDLFELAKTIVDNIIIPIGGMLCVLAFIYSGFMYVTAQGNPGKLKTAHLSLLYASIGTAILLGAWVITNVIKNTIGALMP